MASLPAEQRMDVSCDEANEASLVESAVKGDGAAFTELFNRYYTMIHAFCYRLSLCDFDANDIAQETFIKAARALPSFRRESSFKNWLYRIAAHTSEDWRRRKDRQSRLAGELTSKAAEVQRSPEYQPVAEALGSLAHDLRQAVVLVYYEEMSHAEAAHVLGCAETTISWRIFRAKRKLKDLLSRPEANR